MFWFNMDATFRAHAQQSWMKVLWGAFITAPLFRHATQSDENAFFNVLRKDVSHSAAYGNGVALSKYMTIADLVQNNDVDIVGLTSEDFPDCVLSYEDPSPSKLPESIFDEELLLLSDVTQNDATLKHIRTTAFGYGLLFGSQISSRN